jgi:hypothetical protein
VQIAQRLTTLDQFMLVIVAEHDVAAIGKDVICMVMRVRRVDRSVRPD